MMALPEMYDPRKTINELGRREKNLGKNTFKALLCRKDEGTARLQGLTSKTTINAGWLKKIDKTSCSRNQLDRGHCLVQLEIHYFSCYGHSATFIIFIETMISI
jgi:hypothetical protein